MAIDTITYFAILGWLLLTIVGTIISLMWKPFIHEFKKSFLKHTEIIKVNEDYSLTKVTIPKGSDSTIESKELGGVKTLNAKRMYFDILTKTFTTFNLGSETEPFDFFSDDNSYAVPVSVDDKNNITYKTYRAGRGDAELIEGMILRERVKTKVQEGFFSPEMYALVAIAIMVAVVGYLVITQGLTLDKIVASGGLIRA